MIAHTKQHVLDEAFKGQKRVGTRTFNAECALVFKAIYYHVSIDQKQFYDRLFRLALSVRGLRRLC